MATTSPDNIWTPDSGDNYALTTDLAATADSIQDAISGLRLNGATGLIDTTANRPAAGVKGRTFYATDTDILWFDDGSTWKNRTPGIYVGAISPTGTINGTNTLSWLLTASAFNGVDTGGFYSAAEPTRITLPYTGAYEISFTGRTNGASGVTWGCSISGGAANAYISASGVGAAGAATAGSRTAIMTFTAGDYLTWAQTSTATASGNSTVSVKFLGEV